MKLILILSLILFSGCAAPLMRCDAPALDPDLWHCPDQVQGAYRKCEKPQDIYRCSKPQ